jgi:type I restriction enzyme S subunit
MSDKQEIPSGWIMASVQDIAEIIMGQSPPSATYNKDEIGLPFFQGKAEFTDLHPVAEKWCSEPNKIAINNDILLSVRAPVGTTNIADRECCIGRGLAAIRYLHDHKFIYYYFRSIEQELDKKGTGTTFRAISGDIVKNTKLALPPLPEQHRIVAKIEELFSSLDKGIESLKTAQQQLKIYRQAVLKWAFEGKLTNKNVKDGELPDGWKQIQIKAIAEINPKIPDRENISKQMEVQFLPMKMVEAIINKIHLTEIRQYQDVLEGSYTPFINGDVIFAKVTPCMENGKIAIVDNLKNGIGFGSSEFHVVRAGDKVMSKFIFNYLVQDRFRQEAANEMTGAVGLRRVPKQFIENYSFPLPSFEEQNAIVAEIESRLSVCDKIEESIEQSLKQSESLRQSILKKAFEGKLVPQDPNDEPASKLLERIKSERENRTSVKGLPSFKRQHRN